MHFPKNIISHSGAAFGLDHSNWRSPIFKIGYDGGRVVQGMSIFYFLPAFKRVGFGENLHLVFFYTEKKVHTHWGRGV